jgi:hypothetical protein
MSGKKVSFAKPRPPATGDDWVSGAAQPEASASPVAAEPVKATETVQMKRFTIDVPVELHRRIKAQCAMQGQKMANVLREILEREFPEN